MNRDKYLSKRDKLIKRLEKMVKKGYIKKISYHYNSANRIHEIVIKLPEII